MRLLVVNANGLRLTPGLLAHTWCKIPEEKQRGVYAYVSTRNTDFLLSTALPWMPISDGELYHRGLYVDYFAGVPVIKHPYIQDELVSFMDDEANIYAQIKNLAPPPEAKSEPIDSPKQSAQQGT
jgi:hypothetical protein